MINLKIDGIEISVEDESTILDAAKLVGIDIPTLCHYDGCEPFSSCMVCMVKDIDSDKFIPACSARALEGMSIETDSDELIVARREALELLLSNHVGDCEAICRIACPAFVDIPKMIRSVKCGDMNEASSALRGELALPKIVSRLCHAPCQKACKRGRVDESILIQHIERSVADYDYNTERERVIPNKTCKKVAIVGSGPTGLSVAFYLLQFGHSCVVFEKSDNLSPSLRNIVDLNIDKTPSDLTIEIIDEDIDVIKSMGCEFRTNIKIVEDAKEKDHISFTSLIDDYDAVVIATGADLKECLVTVTNDVIEIDNATFQVRNQYLYHKQRGMNSETSDCDTTQPCLPIKPTGGIKGVFAGGDAILPLGKVIFSVANGRELANSINRFLIDGEASAIVADFDSRSGSRSKDGIAAEVAINDSQNSASTDDVNNGMSEIIQEVNRCLSCDCGKSTNCKLRDLSTKLNATQNRFKEDSDYYTDGNNDFSSIDDRIYGNSIIFEPGKCIKCGVCVRISQKNSKEAGVTFLGRGMETHIGVPFDGDLDDAIKSSANECVNGCPTGALVLNRSCTKRFF